MFSAMKHLAFFGVALAVLELVQSVPVRAGTVFEEKCARLAHRKGDDARRLHELFKLDWDYTMHESPSFATQVGYPGLNGRWEDQSLEAVERRKRELQAPMKVIQSINRSKLSAADQLNYDLFKKRSEERRVGKE